MYAIIRFLIFVFLLCWIFCSCVAVKQQKRNVGYKAELIRIDRTTKNGVEYTKHGKWRCVFRVQLDSVTFDTLRFNWHPAPVPKELVIGRFYILQY
jgi:hypothetical protein